MIYFVRHGQTDWNLQQKLQGRADIPLNENGIAQAQQIAKQLCDVKFHKVFCSPLKRALQTCQTITNCPIVADDRLIEREFGEFEGLTLERFDNCKFWNSSLNQQFDRAESVFQVIERVYDFLNEVTTKYSGQNVLVVCHGGVGMVFQSYFLGKPADGNYYKYLVGNCQVLTFPN